MTVPYISILVMQSLEEAEKNDLEVFIDFLTL